MSSYELLESPREIRVDFENDPGHPTEGTHGEADSLRLAATDHGLGRDVPRQLHPQTEVRERHSRVEKAAVQVKSAGRDLETPKRQQFLTREGKNEP